MKQYGVENLIKRYPVLAGCKEDILAAFDLLKECFGNGHKILIAGNGGSSADADHIVGELMKGFLQRREISPDLKLRLVEIDSTVGAEMAQKLQVGLPAIALHNHPGLNTAFSNDVEGGAKFLFAQQILGYGQMGDVFLGISTSGNSENVFAASVLAKAMGLKVLALTGSAGGRIRTIADVTISAPAQETFVVQELHLPIYHCLCLMLESHFFAKGENK